MSDSGCQLLVVDDDTIVRQSIVAYLEDSGFDVHEESDGRAGLDWFDHHTPDVIITDLRMPEMDGLAILKAVRSKGRETPVIVISGMGGVRDVVEALRLGADDYLVKPLVDMEVLVHSINRALERQRLREENTRYRTDLERANKELKEYVRVLERDHQAGRRVQKKLLPHPAGLFDNIHISYTIIPSLYLSGDFIDYGYFSDRFLAFYLTDVSGHGAASAFVTIWLKQLVRRYSREKNLFESPEKSEDDLVSLLSLVNREVVNAGIGCHMTCFVGLIDTQTNKMFYVIGGHLPLPLIIWDDGAEYLHGKGKPIGIFDNASWAVNSVDLTRSFSILAFSDGVLEILPPENLVEKEAYLKRALEGHQGDISGVCRALGLESLDTAPDDIAILKIDSMGV